MKSSVSLLSLALVLCGILSSGSAISVRAATPIYAGRWSAVVPGPGPPLLPTSVAVDTGGTIFVGCLPAVLGVPILGPIREYDRNHNLVLTLPPITCCNLPGGPFVRVDNRGRVYGAVSVGPFDIYDHAPYHIVTRIYDYQGNVFRTWSSPDADSLHMTLVGFDVDASGTMYLAEVPDQYNPPQNVTPTPGRIEVVDSTGVILRVIPWGGVGGPSTDHLTGIAVGPGGAGFIRNYGCQVVPFHGFSGKFAPAWGTCGAGPGQINETPIPTQFRWDAYGGLYVPDFETRRIMEFTGSGEFLGEWRTDSIGIPMQVTSVHPGGGGETDVYVLFFEQDYPLVKYIVESPVGIDVGPVVATATASGVEVAWSYFGGLVTGFRVERAAGATGPYSAVSGLIAPARTRSDLRFLDTTAESDRVYAYRVGWLRDSRWSYTPPVTVRSSATGFSLRAENSPSSGPMRLAYSIPRGGSPVVTIFDASGRRVRGIGIGATLAGSGSGALTWDGRDDSDKPLPAGVYVGRISLNGQTASCKLVRLR